MTPFDRLHMSSYLSSIVNMAVSSIVFEIKRNTGWKTAIFYTPLRLNLHDHLQHLGIFSKILIQTTQVCMLLDDAKILPKNFNPVGKAQQCHRRQTKTFFFFSLDTSVQADNLWRSFVHLRCTIYMERFTGLPQRHCPFAVLFWKAA